MVLSMDRWIGKVAIVTGASVGIGAAIVKQLVEEGLQVVGLARRPELIEAIAKQLDDKKGKLYALKADVSNEQDILEAFKWTTENLGPIHVLVNNAGILQPTSLASGNTQMWKKIFDVNVLGLCIATREAVQNMQLNNVAGHIIHINSIAGHAVYNIPQHNVYPASKHAVTALTGTLRNELNELKLKIKITSISPGLVKTDIIKASSCQDPHGMMETNPCLNPEDIADGVVYVLSTPPHVQVHELTIKPVNEVF